MYTRIHTYDMHAQRAAPPPSSDLLQSLVAVRDGEETIRRPVYSYDGNVCVYIYIYIYIYNDNRNSNNNTNNRSNNNSQTLVAD